MDVEAIRRQVVSEALSWVGTPFAHQQRAKGLGVDCTNFIAETALASAVLSDVEFEKNYRRRESGEAMIELLCSYMYMVFNPTRARAADVLALCDEQLKQPNKPRHLILLSETERYWKGVHASERGVVHHRLDSHFKRRIHSVWRLPKIVEADGDSSLIYDAKVLFDLEDVKAGV